MLAPDHIIFLNPEKSKLRDRMNRRSDHFMPTSLLDSQLATLERPKNVFELSSDQSLDEMIEMIKEYLAS